MPRRMRGLLTPVSVSVIGFVGGIPPCGAAYFAPGGKAGKAPPGDAPGGTTAPHAFRLSPAVRFPPDPRYGRRGPLAWRPCPARVEDDTYPPVCAAAAGVLNWRAYPTRGSRLSWQNRDSRCKTGGRMICAPTQRPKGIPYFVNSPEIFLPGPRWGRLSPSRGCKGQGEVI